MWVLLRLNRNRNETCRFPFSHSPYINREPEIKTHLTSLKNNFHPPRTFYNVQTWIVSYHCHDETWDKFILDDKLNGLKSQVSASHTFFHEVSSTYFDLKCLHATCHIKSLTYIQYVSFTCVYVCKYSRLGMKYYYEGWVLLIVLRITAHLTTTTTNEDPQFHENMYLFLYFTHVSWSLSLYFLLFLYFRTFSLPFISVYVYSFIHNLLLSILLSILSNLGPLMLT